MRRSIKNALPIAMSLMMGISLLGCGNETSTEEAIKYSSQNIETSTVEMTERDTENTEASTEDKTTEETTTEVETTTIEATEDTSEAKEITSEDETLEEETSEEETTEEEMTVETTTEETTAESVTEEPTAPVETTTIAPVETQPVETTPVETTPVETTPEPTAPVETTVAPVETQPVETTPEETTQAVTLTWITASVSGSFFIGDTLTAANFSVVGNYSDGHTESLNGWAATPLDLASASNTITVIYQDHSTTVTVNAAEKPVEPTQPADNTQNVTYDGTDIVRQAFWCLNLPYVHGGKSPETGFDCSGFVAYCYKQIGITIPSSTTGQKTCGKKISMYDALPGDIVVSEKNGSIHTGIYVGFGVVADAIENTGISFRGIATKNVVDDGTRIYAIRVGNNISIKGGKRYWMGEEFLKVHPNINEYAKTFIGTSYWNGWDENSWAIESNSENAELLLRFFPININGKDYTQNELLEPVWGWTTGNWYTFINFSREQNLPGITIFTDI